MKFDEDISLVALEFPATVNDGTYYAASNDFNPSIGSDASSRSRQLILFSLDLSFLYRPEIGCDVQFLPMKVTRIQNQVRKS